MLLLPHSPRSLIMATMTMSSNAVGIMQIHLHTWAGLADKENINLFNVEDNVELGVRIRTSGFGIRVRNSSVENSRLGFASGIRVWNSSLEFEFGIRVWNSGLEFEFGVRV